MKKSFNVVLTLTLVLLVFSADMMSQEPGKTEMEQIFRKFKNYRFGSVALYQITNIAEIRKAIELNNQSSSGNAPAVKEEELKDMDDGLKQQIKNLAKLGKSIDEIAQELINSNTPFTQTELDKAFAVYADVGGPTEDKIENIFVLTTKPVFGQIPKTIIGMITSTDMSDKLEKNLKSVQTGSIYVYDELKEFALDSSFSASNMYDLIINSFVQQNYRNRTTEMQGIGIKGYYHPRVFGMSKTLISNESDMTNYDIQTFLRISEGQPVLMGLHQNEAIISPDLISWKHYKKPMTWEGDDYIIDSAGQSNYDLPDLGVELRYGIDDINYHSFWSERLTGYALWNSVKLGIILPTAGWSNLATDLYDQKRNLTHGGVGIAGEFQTPIKVIPKSGLFRFSFGYVFGDAVESSYRNRNLDSNYNYIDGDNDFLIRSNFSAQYTFGLAIDDDYKFRFGVGLTGYRVERWINWPDYAGGDTSGKREIFYKILNSDNIVSISGKIEFMVTNISTPYGASLQYFDEAVSGQIWLQLPLYSNIVALRLDAKGFVPIMRSTPHEWEAKLDGLFTPMARLIVNF